MMKEAIEKAKEEFLASCASEGNQVNQTEAEMMTVFKNNENILKFEKLCR